MDECQRSRGPYPSIYFLHERNQEAAGENPHPDLVSIEVLVAPETFRDLGCVRN